MGASAGGYQRMERFEQRIVAGSEALAEWERLRGAFADTGLYPVILGDARDRDGLLGALPQEPSLDEILEEASSVHVGEWLAERGNEEIEAIEDELRNWPEDPGDEMGLTTPNEVDSGRPKSEVIIALLPVSEPAEVFARLRWGGWNDCPWPAEHVAVHRHWAERYGAEPIAITADVIECLVRRPPLERRDALRLAKEQFAYCPEIVEQGTLTLESLAAGLLDSRFWFFWWD